jgi:quercetin dioxygenase-like cupin family protein
MALTHAAPGEKVHLPSLVSLPRDEKTSALVKTGSFEAIHLILRSGSSIPSHAVDGYITLHCLEGTVTVKARTRTELQPGDWLYMEPGEKHAFIAVEDCSLLLTIHFNPS